MLSILWTIIVGFIVGMLAKLLVKGNRSLGFWMTSGLGIAGSFIGSAINEFVLHQSQEAGWIFSTIIAAALLFAYTKFKK
jgi:uncharacterized membrane protein YeaQ/YmgE (transglycosylase-associated protein family)